MASGRIEFNKEFTEEERAELMKRFEEMWDVGLLHCTDNSEWKLKKKGPDGAAVYTKKSKSSGKKVFKLEGVAKLDQATFFQKFFSVEVAEDIPSWNPTLRRVEMLKEFDPHTHIFYQTTEPVGPGDMVAGRDLVLLRKMKVVDGKNIICCVSHEFPEVPPFKNLIRAECFVSVVMVEPAPNDSSSTLLTIITDIDIKLPPVPKPVYNQVFQNQLLDNLKIIRNRCEKIRQQQ